MSFFFPFFDQKIFSPKRRVVVGQTKVLTMKNKI